MAATRTPFFGGGPDAEIWVASASDDLTDGDDWTVVKLADMNSGSVIYDVWGDDAGSITVVGGEVQGGVTNAVIFRR